MTDVPPPVRAGPTARPRWARIVLLVLCVWAALAVISVVVAFVGPGFHGHNDRRFTCQNNLSQLAGLYLVDARRDPATRAHAGQALLLAWRRDGRHIRAGQEGVLICPGDNSVATPDTPATRARYDDVDLDAPPADLCSYAVRDFERFPLDDDSFEPQPIFACVGRVDAGGWHACHKNGFNVAFDDGSARFIEWAELGVDPPGDWPDPTKVIGPDSPVPILRALRW